MTDRLIDAAVVDIPRLFTALAEWGACMVYIVIIRRCAAWPIAALTSVCGLALLIGVQAWAGTLPIAWWIPGMLVAATSMFALIFGSLQVNALSAGYLTARAFVLAELVASVHWQLDRFYLTQSDDLGRGGFLALTYAAMLAGAWLAERRHLPRGAPFSASGGELVSAVAIATATFAISNLSFANASTPFSSSLGREILYIRTLVDLCGYIALYVQREVRRAAQIRQEAEAMSQLLRSQHEQYELSRRTIDEVNRRYHDMRHHLDAVRGESDPRTRERMLDDLEHSIHDYGSQVFTGNRVVDAILTAKGMFARDHGVEVICIADGQLLNFMSPLDVTAVLGNALDNAVEAARTVVDEDERVIHVAVFAQDDFVLIQVENTFDGVLYRTEGRVASRKREPGHGYGLRSIEATIGKYGGSVTIDSDGHWFTLRVLIPRPVL